MAPQADSGRTDIAEDAGQTVNVALGARSYPIHIGPGLIDRAGPLIADVFPRARCAIITDENVGRLHGERLRASLQAAGCDHHLIEVPAGERTKSWPGLEQVVGAILEAGIERGDLVIALGGGVIGDLAGFAAAIVRRGMEFVQIPTSLLAQVDSSVGGKTGINAAQGKNLVGAFHQPVMVIADTELLKTLPAREFRAGYAEIAKYGLIDQPDFFAWLDDNLDAIFEHGPPLTQAIARSCQSKAAIVAADEKEAGARALLNLGHTFGHALEAAAGFDPARLVHGEAVAVGMVLAHEFSNRLNLCDHDSVEKVRTHLRRAGLPVDIADIPGEGFSVDALCGFIAQDKKVKRGKLTFILTRGLGSAYIANDVSPDELRAFLESKLNR